MSKSKFKYIFELRKLARRVGISVLDLLYPPHCYCCERPLAEHKYICSSCIDSISLITPPFCYRCGRPVDREGLCGRCSEGEREFFLARSVGYYTPENILGKCIRGLKYEEEKALARPLASLFLKGPTKDLVQRVEGVCYVPQFSPSRFRQGFNHARLLARNLAHQVDLPLLSILRKVEQTRPQVELNFAERRRNLQNVMEATRTVGRDSLLLVDDVFTTGTTAAECARALKAAGCRKVFIATLARGGVRSERGFQN